MRRSLSLLLTVLLLSASSLVRGDAPPETTWKLIAPGVRMLGATVTVGDDPATTVWLYVPDPLPVRKVPCVVIAPAGTNLFSGMDLEAGDSIEQLPYVQAGMVVVAYSIAGPMEGDGADITQLVKSTTTFMTAQAGLIDEKRALDLALKTVPQIDPANIYTVGHSSAATLSLLVAENEPRIRACVAYAPIGDIVAQIERQQSANTVSGLTTGIPGFMDFLKWASPLTSTDKLKCPVFIFHADDDNVVPLADNLRLVEKLKQTNQQVTFVHVPTGGHYHSMVDAGIPAAIDWLEKQYSSSRP